jgi:hypothetical protein
MADNLAELPFGGQQPRAYPTLHLVASPPSFRVAAQGFEGRLSGIQRRWHHLGRQFRFEKMAQLAPGWRLGFVGSYVCREV